MTSTYNDYITHGHIKTDSGYTFGGYSGSNTVNKKFIIKVTKTHIKRDSGYTFGGNSGSNNFNRKFIVKVTKVLLLSL